MGVEGIDASDVDGHLVAHVTADGLAAQRVTGIVEVEDEIVARRATLLQG